MRLHSVWIEDFKNLHDITIKFDENHLITVLIGKNGTAKSNLIEAFACIFERLDQIRPPKFNYILEYECNDKKIIVDANKKRIKTPMVQITANAEKISYASFKDESIKRKYLPNIVFGYYSGTGTRLERYFIRHRRKFLEELLANKDRPLRPLFYAKPIHSQYVLLSYYSFQDEHATHFLEKYLGITKFVRASFLLKEPDWYNKAKAKDDRFWGAGGRVRVFIDDLYESSIAPEKIPVNILSASGKSRTTDMWYLRIEGIKALQKLASKYKDNANFFKTLESLHASNLIHRLTIEVEKKGVKSVIKFSELSEGEQQLLTVLGLLRFTQEEESLFFLDEPDTHLHPSWKLRYVSLLKNEVKHGDKSHLLIATHDPLTIGGLAKEQVQVFKRGQNKQVTVSIAEENTTGMGVAGMLTSDLFNLPTTLDIKTQSIIDKKTKLTTKKKLTNKDKADLRRWNESLDKMGFNTSFRDENYSQFLRALKKYDLSYKPVLSTEDKKKQTELTKEIIKKIRRSER